MRWRATEGDGSVDSLCCTSIMPLGPEDDSVTVDTNIQLVVQMDVQSERDLRQKWSVPRRCELERETPSEGEG